MRSLLPAAASSVLDGRPVLAAAVVAAAAAAANQMVAVATADMFILFGERASQLSLLNDDWEFFAKSIMRPTEFAYRRGCFSRVSQKHSNRMRWVSPWLGSSRCQTLLLLCSQY